MKVKGVWQLKEKKKNVDDEELKTHHHRIFRELYMGGGGSEAHIKFHKSFSHRKLSMLYFL